MDSPSEIIIAIVACSIMVGIGIRNGLLARKYQDCVDCTVEMLKTYKRKGDSGNQMAMADEIFSEIIKKLPESDREHFRDIYEKREF